MPRSKGMMMTPTDRIGSDEDELDSIAWAFLGSEFTGPIHADWPLDRRIDSYLLHAGLSHIANDGSTCVALLERIMANLRPARRNGLLGFKTARNTDDRHPQDN
ncbi:hypothetical protein [Mycolicibacterium rhodesiae]|nr:hypothetical protein [Mycolicibacterium rhodesiae]